MTTRIKYIIIAGFYGAKVTDIFGREVTIAISKTSPHKVSISKLNTDKTGLSSRKFEQKSIQQAKRKIRKILREEFEVNLGEEVRSKACF